ncbi:MAG: heparinase II/III family protein [Verrucomicrobia bacterium]|nr:heparinase II/III family protein [Verrucomicrobiota bacterium]
MKQQIAANAQLKCWHTNLQSEAQALLSKPPSRYEIPDGLRLLATSRRVLQRVYTLALLNRLDGDPHYIERAWQELAAATKFPDWNPRHFLDTAEMTHAFAIGYDWLYDAWTPEQRATLREAMVEKGLKPALKLYRAQTWWTTAHHNWNQVCNGGIGMGALALAEVEPELAGEILHDALESIQLAMAEFAPDGAWKEGPGYWNYATDYNVVFLAGLQTALGRDFGLSRIGAFEQTGLFPLYLTGPLGRTFNYADGGDNTLFAPQMFWLARRFKQPVLAWYERRATSPSALDLLWFDPEGSSPKAAGLPLDKYFRGAEVAVLRSDWDNPKAVFVGFKAGDNKANHSHLDLGSFVFDAAGVRWAMDLGADNYNLPGYFGGQRWNYYRLRAEGQNTLVINPGEGPDQDLAARAQIIRFESGTERSFAIADLTPAYAKNARRVWRGIALLDRDKVLVQDEIQAGKPIELWWFMHTPVNVQIETNGRTADLQQGGAQLRAEILSPPDAKFQLMDAQPLPTSPHPDGQAKNERVRKLAIHLAGISEARLVVLFVPKPLKAEGAGQAPELSSLAEW